MTKTQQAEVLEALIEALEDSCTSTTDLNDSEADALSKARKWLVEYNAEVKREEES